MKSSVLKSVRDRFAILFKKMSNKITRTFNLLFLQFWKFHLKEKKNRRVRHKMEMTLEE